jgi:hypothetical protein
MLMLQTQITLTLSKQFNSHYLLISKITITMPSGFYPKEHFQGYSPGLPDDEYRFLKNRHSIETHLSSGSSSSSNSSTSYTPTSRNSSLRDLEQSRYASEVRYSTRKALGQSFDFTDDSYDMMNPVSTRHDSVIKDNETSSMPRRYLEKRNWRECAGDLQSQISREQYNGNYNLTGSRQHREVVGHSQSSYGGSKDVEAMLNQTSQYQATYCQGSSHAFPKYRETRDQKPVRTIEISMRPLHSKFSWDDSVYGDE